MKASSLAQSLSHGVVEALVQIELTESDVLGGAIKHTDLPWQVPPLIVEAPLFGASLSEYLTRPTYVNPEQLVNLYTDVLSDMRNDPRKVLSADGYRSTSKVIPHVKQEERGLIFSVPDGWPGSVGDYAGITFALECAHIARNNMKVSEFLSDDDNYCAILPDGMEIGVRDGLPTFCFEQWDLSVGGMVQELLRNPRGAVWEGCDYNVISQVRSVCHIHKSVLKEFEALDWALQALRVIDGERSLLSAMRSLRKTAYIRESRMNALQEAVKVSRAMAMTDRQRIETLKNLLVPDILTPSQFSKTVYGYYGKVPPVVAPKVLMRIQSTVQDMLELEEMLYARVRATSTEKGTL